MVDFHNAVSPHGVSYRCAFLYLFTAFDRLHYDRKSFVLPPTYVLAVIEEIATTHSMEHTVAFQWHFGSQLFMMFMITLHGGCEVVVHIMKFCPISKC